jgi:hypothetical protein
VWNVLSRTPKIQSSAILCTRRTLLQRPLVTTLMLEVLSAQTRLLAVELADVLFRRSRVFRGLLAPRLAAFLVGPRAAPELAVLFITIKDSA